MRHVITIIGAETNAISSWFTLEQYHQRTVNVPNGFCSG